MITEEEGTEEHFQIGAVAITHQKIFDWLDILLLYIRSWFIGNQEDIHMSHVLKMGLFF